MTLGQDYGSRDTVIAETSREELSEKKEGAGVPSNHHHPSSSPSRTLRDESNLVTWDGPDDPDNPHNWSMAYRWWATLLCAVMTLNVTFASSASSPGTTAISEEFSVSEEVTDLTTSLFLVGLALGPILWGPGSEVLGRRLMYTISLSLYTIFHLGQALAPNIQTLLITRFFTSFCGSAPLTLGGGLMADLWGNPIRRGEAGTVFIGMIFLGPAIGPLVGGFIIDSGLGWRWLFWVMMIFAGVVTAFAIFCMPETYAPVLLLRKAQRLRKEDPIGNKDIFAESERHHEPFSTIVYKTLYRPFQLLLNEPILVLITIYISVVYGILYSLFETFPIIFIKHYDFTVSQSGLIFIGIMIGVLFAGVVNVVTMRPYPEAIIYWRGFPPPEMRLYGAMIAGPCLVVGTFFMGWTSQYAGPVPWYVPALSTPFIGTGVTLIFMSFMNYLVDTYAHYAASAFAANVIVRCLFAAAFPLFTNQMYTSLGLNWGSTLIGCFSLLLCPIPFFFHKYGARIRQRSKFAPCKASTTHRSSDELPADFGACSGSSSSKTNSIRREGGG
ncbi:MFS general substrate transporter [Stereum hirsutum FP-91666 SS1]|uniref:MFS general substrate transporter n=1 Tax=Stereum hirsutum (strain FP-91666) TaxID=721885 RepID=UPI000440ADFC|nr:MFS general substrate transporter [Stereum hirsutum FP-91666 SS1]EIM87761.1 MFS general substrate transporter [Stereum hirsutum FP-91666 SS1]